MPNEPTDHASYAQRTTIADVRSARPSRIYYAMHTCWWAFRASDLYKLQSSGLPCDPRGSVLMMSQEGDFEGFLQAAEANPSHYGKHGLRAFEAALHGNVTTRDGRPTSFRTWDAYNELLDRYDFEIQAIRKKIEAGKA